MPRPIDIDIEAIRAQAQKAAWEYDDINAACPYPFNTRAAFEFKDAFFGAKRDMRKLAADKKANS